MIVDDGFADRQIAREEMRQLTREAAIFGGGTGWYAQQKLEELR